MGLRAISSFFQSGNIESLTLTGFEPATLRVAIGHLTHYTKFLKPNSKIFLQSFCCRVAGWIEQQSAISFEKTKNKSRP